MPEQRGIVPQAHRPPPRREQPRPNEGMRKLPLGQDKPPSLGGYPGGNDQSELASAQAGAEATSNSKGGF